MTNKIYTKEEVMASFASERAKNQTTGQTWRDFYVDLKEKAYLAGKSIPMKEERDYHEGTETIKSYMSDGTIQIYSYSAD